MMKRQPWSMLLAGAAILLILLGLIWLTLEAVGGTTFLDAPPPQRLALTADEVLERLEPAASFETISQDFAETLEVPTSSLQARLRPKGCSACEMKESAELDIQPIAAVIDRIPQSDGAWLIKDDLMCFYLVQKEQWTPKSCSIWQ